jgi:hypothetical protein
MTLVSSLALGRIVFKADFAVVALGFPICQIILYFIEGLLQPVKLRTTQFQKFSEKNYIISASPKYK